MSKIGSEQMSEKSPKEKAEEQASLMRQGAGNYSNLCGVLAGFVAVIIVLVLTPGFFPRADTDLLLELVVVLFSISSFGYVFTAVYFVGISAAALWEYKSLEDMEKDYHFSQASVFLFTLIFLLGIAVLSYSMGTVYIAITDVVGVTIIAIVLIRSWWALARRPPPKKMK